MRRKPESTNLKPLRLVEDQPILNSEADLLAMEPFARIVAGAAVGTEGPFTIGVYATWGYGKTSLLRQAKCLIEGDPNHADVVTVWFNAWQFERDDHPMVPLVATLVHALERQRRENATATDHVKAGWLNLSRMLRAIAYGFSAKTKVGVPGFAEVEAGFVAKEMIDREGVLAVQGDPLLDRSIYYSAFELLEKTTGPGISPPRIVVFIDDLDRCLPESALHLLESIKLVLAQKGFVFVLALDHQIVESYLTQRYRDKFGAVDYAAGVPYLDKMVQLPFPCMFCLAGAKC